MYIIEYYKICYIIWGGLILFHPEYIKTTIVSSDEDLFLLADKFKRAKYVTFDTETSGLDVRYPGKVFIVGFTVAFEDEISEEVFYVPLAHEIEGKYVPRLTNDLLNSILQTSKDKNGTYNYKKDFPEFDESMFEGEYYNANFSLFKKLFIPLFHEGDKHFYITQNGGYDFHVMANLGIDMEKVITSNNYDDTMIMLHTVNENMEKKLEHFIFKMFGIRKSEFATELRRTVTAEEKKSFGLKSNENASYQHITIPIGAQYSGEDVWFTKQSHSVLKELLEKDELYEVYRELRIPFSMSLWRMERQGTSINIGKLDKMKEFAEQEREKLLYNMYELVGTTEFKPTSDVQLRALLFGFLTKRKSKKTGEYLETNNEGALEMLKISFGFKPSNFTDGGKNKDSNLKAPQCNADSLEYILKSTKAKNEWQKKGLELVKLIIRFKRLEKLYSAFIVGMYSHIYADGKVHPSFNICGTDSGRISCSNPNLQQLPRPLEVPVKPEFSDKISKELYEESLKSYEEDKKEFDFWKRFEIRDLIVPSNSDNYIVAADYSNLEKRITAHFTEDKNLVDLINNGYDAHGFVAKIIFPDELKDVDANKVKKVAPHLRQIAKSISFAMDYGGTEFTVSQNLGISKELARQYIDNYNKGFSELAKWDAEQKRFARRYGFVYTLLGRKRHLEEIRSSNKRIASYNERLALNAPIQGTASEVIALAQMEVENSYLLKSIGLKLLIQVHDELVFECPKKYVNLVMYKLDIIMPNCLPSPLIVPLPVGIDFGETYAEAK